MVFDFRFISILFYPFIYAAYFRELIISKIGFAGTEANTIYANWTLLNHHFSFKYAEKHEDILTILGQCEKANELKDASEKAALDADKIVFFNNLLIYK